MLLFLQIDGIDVIAETALKASPSNALGYGIALGVLVITTCFFAWLFMHQKNRTDQFTDRFLEFSQIFAAMELRFKDVADDQTNTTVIRDRQEELIRQANEIIRLLNIIESRR